MTDRLGLRALGRPLTLLVLLLAPALAGATPAVAPAVRARPQTGPGDWPEWRGPDGLGVSSASGLPERLAADAESLLWRIEVKGEGISSPIVVGQKVFLTTAYPGAEQSRARNLKRFGVPVLAAILLLLGLARLRRGPDPASGPAGRLDAGLTALATAGFVVGALLAAYRPGVFPSWAPGVQGWAWFYTAAIALVGLGAAAGWSSMRSGVRLLAVLALAAFAVHAWRDIGLNSYGQTFKTKYRLVMVAPAVAGALWHLAAFLLARRTRQAAGGTPHHPRAAAAAGALALVFLAAILFSTVNYLQPRAGLMRAVLCHDLESGRLLWDAPLFVAPEEQKFESNSFATPTAVSDGEILFAYFGSGWAALDLDGNVLWLGRDEEYAPNTRYGTGASPVLYQDTFIILQEKEYVRPSFIAAFDKRTGAERWRVNPFYASDSYCTPLLVPRGAGFELVTASAERAVAHSPENGELLWQVALPIRQMVPSLCYRGDMLFVAGGTHTKTSTSGIRLTGTGKATRPEVVWQSSRGTPECASPVLANGLYFTVADGGLMSCYDPDTGDKHWFERLGPGEYWSSLVAAEGRVYVISDEGHTFTVAAEPEFQVLAQGELGEPCLATPAIAHGRILVRTFEHLYCFGTADAPAR